MSCFGEADTILWSVLSELSELLNALTIVSSSHGHDILFQQQASASTTRRLAGTSSSNPRANAVPRGAGSRVVAGQREPSGAVGAGAATTIHGRACYKEHLHLVRQQNSSTSCSKAVSCWWYDSICQCSQQHPTTTVFWAYVWRLKVRDTCAGRASMSAQLQLAQVQT
jgi:hypothetical protein